MARQNAVGDYYCCDAEIEIEYKYHGSCGLPLASQVATEVCKTIIILCSEQTMKLVVFLAACLQPSQGGFLAVDGVHRLLQ